MSTKSELPDGNAPDFELIESLGWSDGYLFFEEHLARLERSAAYFGFSCQADRVAGGLLRYEQYLSRGHRYKVRLRLAADGRCYLENEEINESAPKLEQLVLARARVHSRNEFLFHKTTRRTFYDNYLREARGQGHAEVFFLNERDELTECANHNLFLLAPDGRLLTPSVDCGLLAGIYRDHLLKTDPRSWTGILKLNDLTSAKAIYICNSVRGMHEVRWAGELQTSHNR